MALRHETRPETQTLETVSGTIERETEARKVVFDLVCACGTICGEVAFPEDHGRENDEALEEEMLERYPHTVCSKCAATESSEIHSLT